MAQKRVVKKKVVKKAAAKKHSNKPASPVWYSHITDKHMLFASLALMFIYYAFSTISNGFYQHDEVAHFNSMRDFWHNPDSILGIWAKPGFKILYVIPALLGVWAVKLLTCAFAAFSAFFTYKILKKFDRGAAILGFVLLATAQMWVSLAFRSYSELPTAFFLILFGYLFIKEKYIWAAISLSYCGFMRQELYVLIAAYFVFFVIKKKFLPALALGIFPIVNHLWGWAVTGDPLYLYTATFGTSEGYADLWRKMGWYHFYQFLSLAFSGLILISSIAYVTYLFIKKEKPVWVLLMVPIGFLMIQSLFNWNTIKIGPGTGGNIRYLVVIAPYFAALAALGLYYSTKFTNWNEKIILGGILLFILAIHASFVSYNWNGSVEFNKEIRDWRTTREVLAGVVLILVGMAWKWKAQIGMSIAIIVAFIAIKPWPISDEDQTVKQVAEWYQDQPAEIQDAPILCSHTLFHYFIEKTPKDFEPDAQKVFKEKIDSASVGSIIIYDTHYAGKTTDKRNNFVRPDYFTSRPQAFKMIKDFVSPQKRFATYVFQKIGDYEAPPAPPKQVPEAPAVQPTLK